MQLTGLKINYIKFLWLQSILFFETILFYFVESLEFNSIQILYDLMTFNSWRNFEQSDLLYLDHEVYKILIGWT